MRVFVYSIAADQDRPSEGEGYVRAETIQQAVALIGHPEVNVYPLPADDLARTVSPALDRSRRAVLGHEPTFGTLRG